MTDTLAERDGERKSSFVPGAQHRGSHPGHQIVFYAFDLIHLDGKDLTGEPPLKRRARLPRVLEGCGVLLSEELPGTAAAIVEAVRGLGLEGVIAKRKDSAYEPGERSDACSQSTRRMWTWSSAQARSTTAGSLPSPSGCNGKPWVFWSR